MNVSMILTILWDECINNIDYRRKVISLVQQFDEYIEYFGDFPIIEMAHYASYGRKTKKEIEKILKELLIYHCKDRPYKTLSGGVTHCSFNYA